MRRVQAALAGVLATLVAGALGAAEIRPGVAVRATWPGEAQVWADWIDSRAKDGSLRLLRVDPDSEVPGRTHARYEQLVNGVPVFGVQLVRQVDGSGVTRTVFGYRFAGAPPSTVPLLAAADARRIVGQRMPPGAVVSEPSLVILPVDDEAALAYMLWGRHTQPPTHMRYFIDARTGAVLLRLEDLKSTEVPVVGLGTGSWSDRKKLATVFDGSRYLTIDRTRPVRAATYDMKFDTWAWLYANDVGYEAASDDNTWVDGAVVDAHAYAGQVYDYFYARHGRKGVDGQNGPIKSYVHVLPGVVNAYWDDLSRSMTYGDGGIVGSTKYGVLSSALDVVAHELTHGVTTFSWNGVYEQEPGALNEAFSDIMATSVEFMWEPPGDARNHADYWIGEDAAEVFEPSVSAFRSMENPARFGLPDHWSLRYVGPTDEEHDWGGVHINSSIANQAFYLLVEGGTNRTSGIQLTGLGSARRVDAERIFYRGFTQFLTPLATFQDARAATVRAAEELFGAGSDAVRQTAAAWTAVGVE